MEFFFLFFFYYWESNYILLFSITSFYKYNENDTLEINDQIRYPLLRARTLARKNCKTCSMFCQNFPMSRIEIPYCLRRRRKDSIPRSRPVFLISAYCLSSLYMKIVRKEFSFFMFYFPYCFLITLLYFLIISYYYFWGPSGYHFRLFLFFPLSS